MKSVDEQIDTLFEIKDGIRDAIIEKGVTVEEGTPFSQYAYLIDNITGGGGDNISFIEKDSADRNLISTVKGGARTANYSVVGSPTVTSDFIASGFSTSSYLVSPNIHFSEDDKVEFFIRVNFSATGNQFIATAGSNHYGIALASGKYKIHCTDGNKISTIASSTGSWLNLVLVQQNNTLTFTNGSSTYTVNNAKVFNLSEDNIVLGTSINWESMKGSIDLNFTYLKINNAIVWRATLGTLNIL